ncbi:hypothetical protein SUGI_0986060 [Cryptomeria japonica]|uniref:cytokinin dehydrogenase 9 isoform X1 n=2 Tax=Cryptomeria japonica TaxID=3369 RepID=UPI0024149957|nr:cytokinin dehydrogenase 9 isoform X1 [Cryptomeria japonica]GLJ46756.1 hypothetical protein SUGI_0986060 [Cryptomeria japonica]
MENQVNWLIENRTSVLVLIFVIARLISAVGLTLDLAVCKGCLSLTMLDLEGHIDFHNTQVAATDFGNHKTALPAGVLYPRSVADVASLVTSIYKLSGGGSNLTVAARGHAHSLNGQAQAEGGIVINMGSMKGGIRVDKKGMYAEVSGGELWIELLNATLEVGLAPKSWTDYLYLTVGGTLSNAGVSGQAFRHGPQITNVYHLEVVTGKGDVLTCSKHHNAQLFHAVLGGLGQFGIITKATVALEPAPHRVKWIRVLYSDFKTFTQDQENLISRPEEGELTFDYVEGFVIVNNGGLLSNWRSSFFSPQNPVKVSSLNTTGRVLYCLEMTLNYMHENFDKVDEDVTWLLSSLHFIPGSVFMTDLSYVEFLDRVHTSEIKLQKQGLWDVPHPWLNLMVPKSKIHEFDARVFKDILRNTSSGPILIYPMNRNKWDDKMSAVTPEEDIFYLVGLLRSALRSERRGGPNSEEFLRDQNERILDFCNREGMGVKQYLPQYSTESEWKKHFGGKWNRFSEWKATYDPSAILAPGQRIFSRPARSPLAL